MFSGLTCLRYEFASLSNQTLSIEVHNCLQGSTQITSVEQEGRNYIATVNKGDLWYFPPGLPHSLQGTADGTEFLLVRLLVRLLRS